MRIEVMAFEWIGHLTSCERTSDFSGATTQQKGELVKRSVHGTGYRTLLTVRFLTAGAALLLAMLATSVQSALPANAVSPVTVRPLSGELTPVPVGDTLIGPASPSTKMSLEVTLQPRNPSALAAEVNAVSTPDSPYYRHFITPAVFEQEYGPTPATIARVTAALKAEGLTVGAISRTGLYLPVTGTVAQTESAFVTPEFSYELHSGGLGFYNSAEPSVPSSVASDIEGIIGLNTLNVAQPVGPIVARGHTQKVTRHASPQLAPNQPTPGASCSSSFTTLRMVERSVLINSLPGTTQCTLYSKSGLWRRFHD